MRLPVTFKLKPSPVQANRAQSWRPMVRAARNYLLADRINTYAASFAMGPFCSLDSKGEAEPLTCSVRRSAALGSPWKESNPNLRRSKIKGDYCDLKTRKQKAAFNPRRDAYQMHSSYLTEMKQHRPWYRDVNADVLQQSIRNLDKAFQNFFAGRAQFPQFKQTCDIDSLEFKAGTVRFDESSRQVYLPTLGWMGYFKSRDLGNGYIVRTAWLKFEADGLYVVALLEYSKAPDYALKPESELRTVNGLDRGIHKIVAGADGEVAPNPRINKQYERRLAIRQRRLSRKKKGSKNRAKAGQRVARVHQKIKRVREDFQWKLARKEAAKADVIGLEDLNIKGMKARCKPRWDEEQGRYVRNGQAAKSGLNKAISDAAWYSLELKLIHQAKKLGNWVVKVPAQRSSQECSQCHYVSPKNRDGEKFVCENCGHHADADIDAGVIIAQRTIQLLGIAKLRVVSPKVTPAPEVTGALRKELSVSLEAEPGNQAEKVEQLCLFSDLSGESPDIALSA